MKKLIVLFLIFFAFPVQGMTLWQYYGGRLPSCAERKDVYSQFFEDEYRCYGNAKQNTKLVAVLIENDRLNDNALAEVLLGGFNSGQTFRGGGFVEHTSSFTDASTTIFSVQNPFANATSTAFITITGTNGTTTIDILVGTSTTAFAPVGGNLPSPTLINATVIATSTQFTSHSGVLIGSDLGYTSPGSASVYRISVPPSGYVLGQATSSYAGSSATGLQGITNTNNTFTGNYFVTWHR